MFIPILIGLPALDCLLRKAWQKKIPQRSEDDFLLRPTSP